MKRYCLFKNKVCTSISQFWTCDYLHNVQFLRLKCSQFHSYAIEYMYTNRSYYRTVVCPNSHDCWFDIRLYLQSTNIFIYSIASVYFDKKVHLPTHAFTALSIVKPTLHSHRNDPGVFIQFWLLSHAVLSTTHSSMSNFMKNKNTIFERNCSS